jgi:hypothetical protein
MGGRGGGEGGARERVILHLQIKPGHPVSSYRLTVRQWVYNAPAVFRTSTRGTVPMGQCNECQDSISQCTFLQMDSSFGVFFFGWNAACWHGCNSTNYTKAKTRNLQP